MHRRRWPAPPRTSASHRTPSPSPPSWRSRGRTSRSAARRPRPCSTATSPRSPWTPARCRRRSTPSRSRRTTTGRPGPGSPGSDRRPPAASLAGGAALDALAEAPLHGLLRVVRVLLDALAEAPLVLEVGLGPGAQAAGVVRRELLRRAVRLAVQPLGEPVFLLLGLRGVLAPDGLRCAVLGGPLLVVSLHLPPSRDRWLVSGLPASRGARSCQQRADEVGGLRGVLGIECGARDVARLLERHVAQRLLDLRHARRRDAQAADAEAGQQDGGGRVPGQLAADADGPP